MRRKRECYEHGARMTDASIADADSVTIHGLRKRIREVQKNS
jgi:hypothetical protein